MSTLPAGTRRDVAPPPSFSLTGSEFIRAARREARAGGLTSAEAATIAEVVGVFSVIPYELLVLRVRRVFRDLAAATTPDRAEEIALWTPFDTERLREASEQAHSTRTRKAG